MSSQWAPIQPRPPPRKPSRSQTTTSLRKDSQGFTLGTNANHTTTTYGRMAGSDTMGRSQGRLPYDPVYEAAGERGQSGSRDQTIAGFTQVSPYNTFQSGLQYSKTESSTPSAVASAWGSYSDGKRPATLVGGPGQSTQRAKWERMRALRLTPGLSEKVFISSTCKDELSKPTAAAIGTMESIVETASQAGDRAFFKADTFTDEAQTMVPVVTPDSEGDGLRVVHMPLFCVLEQEEELHPRARRTEAGLNVDEKQAGLRRRKQRWNERAKTRQREREEVSTALKVYEAENAEVVAEMRRRHGHGSRSVGE